MVATVDSAGERSREQLPKLTVPTSYGIPLEEFLRDINNGSYAMRRFDFMDDPRLREIDTMLRHAFTESRGESDTRALPKIVIQAARDYLNLMNGTPASADRMSNDTEAVTDGRTLLRKKLKGMLNRVLPEGVKLRLD